MTNQKRAPGLARNAIANWILFAFIAIVSFFLSPFVVRHLGATRYGVWSLLAGLVGYIGLLDFGIRQAVSRYIAHHRAVAAHEECALIVSAAIKLFGLLGILAIVLSSVVALLAPDLFNIPETLVNDTRIIIVLGGLSVAVSLIGGAFGGVLTGLERFDVNCCLEVFVTAARTVAFVIALREGYGLVLLACIQLGASILSCTAFWVTIHKLSPLRLQLRGPWFPQARGLLSFGASLTVISFLVKLISSSDSVIIAAFLPIEAVTFFAIAGSLCLYAKEVLASLSYVMIPRVSALTSMGSNRVGDEILAVARIATLIAAPMAVTFMIRGESFITLWMGSAYGPMSGEVLTILAIVVWLEAARTVVINSLTGMGKQSTLIPGIAFEAICKLALSFVLVRPFGIVGVAMGTLIPSLLVNFGFVPRCLSNAAGIPVRLFYRNALLLPTVACGPFALASAVLERLVPATNLVVFFAQVVLILPLVPITAWFLCLTAEEKRQVGSAIRKVVGK